MSSRMFSIHFQGQGGISGGLEVVVIKPRRVLMLKRSVMREFLNVQEVMIMELKKLLIGLVLGCVVGAMLGFYAYYNCETCHTTTTCVNQTNASSVDAKIYFFYMDSCPHCQRVKPAVEELAKEYNVTFCDMNNLSDECEKVAIALRVTRVPTVVILQPTGYEIIAGEGSVLNLHNFLACWFVSENSKV